MKKIFTCLLMMLATLNAVANNFVFYSDGGALLSLDGTTMTEDQTIYFDNPIIVQQPESIYFATYDTWNGVQYLKASNMLAACSNRWQVAMPETFGGNEFKENMILEPGTYYGVKLEYYNFNYKIYMLTFITEYSLNTESNDLDRLSTWSKMFYKRNDGKFEAKFEKESTVSNIEEFSLWNNGTNQYLKTSAYAANNKWRNISTDNNDNCRYMRILPGKYTGIVYDPATGTLEFLGEATATTESYTLAAITSGVLNSLGNKTFTKVGDFEWELLFPSPITLSNDEEFKLNFSSQTDIRQWSNEAATSWTGIGSTNNSSNMKLKSGSYYSATIEEGIAGNSMHFNTYAQSSTGFDALASSAADYVMLGCEIKVQYQDGEYFGISTADNVRSTTDTAIGDAHQYYSDDASQFTQYDWARVKGIEGIEAGRTYAAGTIINTKSNTIVKLGDVGGTFSQVLNTYRPINFDRASSSHLFLMEPQEGEMAVIRGIYVADGNKISDTNGNAVAIANTITGVTSGAWYDFPCYLLKEIGTWKVKVYGNATDLSTGVGGVEAPIATVTTENGAISIEGETVANISVYTTNGQLVSAVNAATATINVAPGFYLVKVNNSATKVVVK